MKPRTLLILLGCLMLMPPAKAQEAGDAALAARLAQMSQTTLNTVGVRPTTLRQSLALLQAAHRLEPDNPVWARLTTEAALSVGDRQAALESLSAYRRLQPRDTVAQAQAIDLHADAMETVDERIRYLEQLLDIQALSPEVRSHAAARAARLLIERVQESRARTMVDRALGFNPLNLQALRLRYAWLSDEPSHLDRIDVLLRMLQSNPAQPVVMRSIAYELAELGMTEQSIEWYERTSALANRMGLGGDPSLAIAYAAQLYIAGRSREAQNLSRQLAEVQPFDADALFMLMLTDTSSGDDVPGQALRQQVRSGLIGRVNALHALLVEDTSPGEPETRRLPDLLADVQRLREAQRPQLTTEYARALTDLAWFEIYFIGDTQAASPIIDALRQLLSDQSLTVARLEGWRFLVDGKLDEASVRLGGVAELDPLSELGMLRISQKRGQPIDEQAGRLLNLHPTGLLGVFLAHALKDTGAQVVASEQAEKARQLLDRFPQDWLSFNEKPQSFYRLHAQPRKVAHAFAEPMWATVSVTNISQHPITLGPDGALRTDLWFDVQVRGLMQTAIPGVAFERLGQRLVLRPGEQASVLVRLDQGPLVALLSGSPQLSVPLHFSVFTNPMSQGDMILPGPGGQRTQLARVVERSASPINELTLPGYLAQLTTGNEEQKMRTIDLLAAFVPLMRDERATEEARRRAEELVQAIDQTTADASPNVQAWAKFVMVQLVDPQAKVPRISRMADATDWRQRLLAAQAAQGLDDETVKSVLQRLSQDSTPQVAAVASAILNDSPNAQPAP